MADDIEAGNDGGIRKKIPKLKIILRTSVHAVFFVHHNVVLIHGVFYFLDAYVSGIDKLWEACVFFWAFATNWNMLFQMTFLTLSLWYDVLEWRRAQDNPLGQKIKYYRDVVFSGLVVSLTLFVSSFFWVIYWIDRELVYPTVYDKVVPFWFNHCVHTNVTVLLLLETLLQARRYPTNEKLETGCVITIGLSYAIVYYSIYFFAHRWLYGVFALMTWWQVCLFQILIWGINYFYYRIHYPINRIFHKEKVEDKQIPNGNEIDNKEIDDENKNQENGHTYRENGHTYNENGHTYSESGHTYSSSIYLKSISMKDQCEKTKF